MIASLAPSNLVSFCPPYSACHEVSILATVNLFSSNSCIVALLSDTHTFVEVTNKAFGPHKLTSAALSAPALAVFSAFIFLPASVTEVNVLSPVRVTFWTTPLLELVTYIVESLSGETWIAVAFRWEVFELPWT